MRRFYRSFLAAIGISMVAFLPSGTGQAADFYDGKTITLVIGFPTGGGFDAFGRTVARHLNQHIPGKPGIVVQNMPGASSLNAANWLFNKAPSDGTVIGLIHGTATLEPLFKNDKALFDVRRFNWIGSPSTEYGIAFTWHTSQTRSIADARKRETPMAGISTGAPADFMTAMQNNLLGTRLKLVTGYPGTGAAALAIERGEVEGIGGWYWSSLNTEKADWLRDRKVNLLLQLSLEPHTELTKRGVPFIFDLIKDAEARQVVEVGLAFLAIGRPFVAPPGVPASRIGELRSAFDRTVADPEFVKDASARRLPVERPRSGKEVEQLLADAYAAPRSIVDKVVELHKRTR